MSACQKGESTATRANRTSDRKTHCYLSGKSVKAMFKYPLVSKNKAKQPTSFISKERSRKNVILSGTKSLKKKKAGHMQSDCLGFVCIRCLGEVIGGVCERECVGGGTFSLHFEYFSVYSVKTCTFFLQNSDHTFTYSCVICSF